MTDNERLAPAPGKRPQARPPPPAMEKTEPERVRKRALIVKVPDIPSEIRPLPRSMVAVDPVKASELETSQVKRIEDLFEDDEETGEKAAASPSVSIVKEPATEPVRDVLPDTISGSPESQDSFFEDDTQSAPDARENAGEPEPGKEGSHPDTGNVTPVPGQDIALNRTQWLDLLKWSHHCDALEPEQRMQIVRMGRLIQKGRRLTKKQEEQVVEMIALVKRLGYHIR